MEKVRNLLRKSLPDAIGGLISSAVLAVIALLSGILNIDEQLAKKAVLIVCYVLLWFGTTYIFVARRKGAIDPGRTYHRFGWRARVFSIIVVVAATGLVIWALLPYRIPRLPIELTNSQDNDIAIADSVEFMLWLDVPLGDDQPITTGRLRLQCESCQRTAPNEFTVPAHSNVLAYLEVPNPDRYRRFFEMEGVYMFVAAKNRSGRWVSSSDNFIDFNRAAFESQYLPIELDQ